MLTGITVGLALATAGLAAVWWRAHRTIRTQRAAMDAAVQHLGSSGRIDEREHTLAAATRQAIERLDEQTERGERLAETLSHAPFGLIVVDAGNGVVFANAGAERYLKGRHGDAVAEAQIRECIEETAQRRSPTSREVELYTPTRRVLGVQSFPLSHDGRHSGVAVFLEDLTAERRVDAIRKDFVANASHELKTPLGALSILAETLADADDTETRHRLSERLTDQTRRMSRLIDDILDLSLIEATGADRAPVTLDEVLTDSVKHVQVISEEYRVPIIVEPAGLDVLVAGEHRQLVSAFSNLLENAIKYTYTSDGQPTRPVEVRAWRDGEMAVVEVEDHGIGIPLQHQPRVFERFYRVDPARSRRTGGTGLGLAIVRHVVRNHEGTIEVRSQPAVGSLFRIALPLWSR